MDLLKSKYVILEIIPTNLDPRRGDIAQLSAIKIDGIKLEDRFDYRLKKDKIKSQDILNMINYDNEMFSYENDTKSIKEKFKEFITDLPLLIIDNEYTKGYLSDFDNEIISAFDYFDLPVTFDVFDKLISKYKLEPSNYLVDLIYEALIKEL